MEVGTDDEQQKEEQDGLDRDEEAIGLPLASKFVFSIPGVRVHIDTAFNISIENTEHMYTLVAIIYFANSHFTAQIITHDREFGFTMEWRS